MDSLRFLKNRYLLTSIIFIIWMVFLDKDDLLSKWNLDKKLMEVEKQKEYYEKEIQKIKTGLSELQKNPGKLEKYAREKYYMKKDGEDLYVLLPVQSEKKPNQFFNKLHSIFAKPIPESTKK